MILSDLVRLFSPIILEILDQVVDFSIYGERVGRELDLLDRKLPKKIVFYLQINVFWARKTGTKLNSFNWKSRHKMLFLNRLMASLEITA
jgi:hypothetical protein